MKSEQIIKSWAEEFVLLKQVIRRLRRLKSNPKNVVGLICGNLRNLRIDRFGSSKKNESLLPLDLSADERKP